MTHPDALGKSPNAVHLASYVSKFPSLTHFMCEATQLQKIIEMSFSLPRGDSLVNQIRSSL